MATRKEPSMQNEPTPTYSDDATLQAIYERGYEHGRAAGSWVIDGNATDDACRALLDLDEEGDPALYDALPTLTLGEYAGDPTFEEILSSLDIEPDEDADCERWDAYSTGWHDGAHDQALADARARCPRVTAEIGTSGRTVTLDLTGDAREDLAAAVEAEHGDCTDNTCDIRVAYEAGYPYVAAGLLSGATECPLVEAVAAYHGYDLDIYRSEDWQGWKDYHDRYSWECSCGSFVYDEDGNEYSCDNCGGERPPVFGLGVVYVDGEALDEPLDCEDSARVQVELGDERAIVNSAAITFQPDDESVTVSISVGDPRGAFTMTVRRLTDGSLVLHVPHAGDSTPHMPLVEDHPGTYRIGAA